MIDTITLSLSWPTFPMSVMLIICLIYWSMVIIGVLDLDVLDFNTEVELGSPIGVGFVGLRFLNIGNVPLMLWFSIFSLSGWLISMSLNPGSPLQTTQEIATAVGWNIGLALVATKLLTQPLRGRFDPVEPHRPADLIGHQCVVTSSKASPEFGQVRFKTEAAPLLLSVHTRDGEIPRGSVVEIVDYIPETSTYIVIPIKTDQEV